jgi:DNA primase
VIGEQRFNCPECPKRGHGTDRKRHLNVNVAKGVLHCFRCGFGKGVIAEKYCQENGLDVQGDWAAFTEQRTRPPLRLPEEYTTDFTSKTMFGPKALNYLLSRGLTRTLVAAYDIGHCPTGSHHHRVIVPVYEAGMLVNWQGRDWTGAQELRHMGPHEKHGKPDPNSMFNFARVAKTGVILLVEGIYDALRIPEHGVGILGKGWSPEKRAQVLRAKPTTVYVCLDADAKVEDQRIHEDLAGCVPHVESITLSAATKDLGAASRQEVARVRQMCRAAVVAAKKFAVLPGREVRTAAL